MTPSPQGPTPSQAPVSKTTVEIYHMDTGKIEKEFDVTGKGERYISKLVSGISINLGDSYGVRTVYK